MNKVRALETDDDGDKEHICVIVTLRCEIGNQAQSDGVGASVRYQQHRIVAVRVSQVDADAELDEFQQRDVAQMHCRRVKSIDQVRVVRAEMWKQQCDHRSVVRHDG